LAFQQAEQKPWVACEPAVGRGGLGGLRALGAAARDEA
jgi:hypothetical protein